MLLGKRYVVVKGGNLWTIVEDFFTAGAGTAGDPASCAAVGAIFARGMANDQGGDVAPGRSSGLCDR